MVKSHNLIQSIGFLLFFLLNVISETATNVDDILYWSENRLTFIDFKGKPKQSDTTLQELSSKYLTHKLGAIVTSIDVNVLTERNKTTFTIRAGMQQNLSWIKDHGDTIELKHEQGHFDITEIYARMLRRNIKNAQSLSEAKEIYEKALEDEQLEQDKYDKDNTYQRGGITHDWCDEILIRLKKLEAHKNPIVALPFNN